LILFPIISLFLDIPIVLTLCFLLQDLFQFLHLFYYLFRRRYFHRRSQKKISSSAVPHDPALMHQAGLCVV